MNTRELASGLFRILETGDPSLAAQVVAVNNHNREAAVSPLACQTPGPAGTLASGAWMRSAFSDLRFPIEAVTETDDQVWVRLRMQGRHTGPFVRFREGRLDQAIPPTGRDIDFEQIHMLTIRNGQVVDHQAVRDDLTMLAQLGVFPPAPATAVRLLGWRISGRASRAAREVAELATQAAGQLTPATTATAR
jgi:predicted ester cyclase